jgi:hypothetical protein
MGILVKGEITITKGFKTWKEMVYAQDGKLKEHGIKFIFAGTQKDDPTKLHTVMQFPNMEALQAFRDDKELTEKRKRSWSCYRKCCNDYQFQMNILLTIQIKMFPINEVSWL